MEGTLIIILFGLALWFVICSLVSYHASERGMRYKFWFWFVFFTGLIGLAIFILLILPSGEQVGAEGEVRPR